MPEEPWRLRFDSSHGETGARGRIAELDSLRGLAALAIVVFHSNSNRLPFGWAAVDLFFVLSGYLITGIVLRHGGSRGFLPRFYMRRGLRVWPIYYGLVLSIVVIGPFLPRPVRWEGLPYVLTFTQGTPIYWSSDAPFFSPYLGHAWTLAIEEQFYLLWPVLILLVGRRGVIPLASAAIAGAVMARALGMRTTLLAGRCDGLALGAILAVLLAADSVAGPTAAANHARRARGFGRIALLAVIGLVVLRLLAGPKSLHAHPHWPASTILVFNLLWFGVVGRVASLAGTPSMAWLRRPLPRTLGTISYGLYLYHLVIMLLAHDLMGWLGYRTQPPWLVVISLGLCFIVSWASWTFLEEPILRWKDRFAYRDVPRPSSARTQEVDAVSGSGWTAQPETATAGGES